MNNVVPIHRDAHREAVSLLPWYVSGALAEADVTLVEAHLQDCADCRAELDLERRIAAEVAALPVESEPAWAAMERRLDAPARRRTRANAPRQARIATKALPWLGWAVAAQILLLLGVRAMVPAPAAPSATSYHALAAPSTSPIADAAVIFRPTTTDAEVQAILRASGARIVGGPTAAGAWLLAVPMSVRNSALSSLRARREVMTAEPVDPAGP